MILFVLFLSIFAFIRTLGYAIYEYKENSNKSAGIIIAVLSFIILIGPPIVTLF